MGKGMDGSKFLVHRQIKPGLMKCALNLGTLYPEEKERRGFEERFARFLKSDPYNRKVYDLEHERLTFYSEQLIPGKKDNRSPLLLVFGNPAPRSVSEGMFFAYEGKEKEHRFWKHIIGPTGLLDFSFEADLSISERNKRRKKGILDLDYTSAFRVGLTVFVTLPSGSSGPWSGNAGIRRLLGVRAMRGVIHDERGRVLSVVKRFLGDRGTVITFQRDAWEGLRSPGDPAYHIDSAKRGRLVGVVHGSGNYGLYGLPPTRLTGPCRRVLSGVMKKVLYRVAGDK